ncbi:MAG: GNAT family N-acetyltransferase [Saprospirales bacterium]|nr:GNAT family N-acetyltransferase [Saprospirales bacterium]
MLVNKIKDNRWVFRLNNQPSWAPYMPVFLQTLKESSLFFRELKYNACLVINEQTPEALFKTCDKQKLRQKMHRLEDQGNLTFEVYREEEDLENWLGDFYDMHVKRWAGTNTPSNLQKKERREFFTQCVQSWIEDGILVRFSLKLNDKRIAFVIALLENESLVHHSTTFDIEYTKQSPGLIIIRLIAKWMEAQKMTKMEFGDGDEGYKYMFTKDEWPMHRLFISSPHNFPFMLKTGLIHSIWEKPAVHKYYFEKIRPLLLRSSFIKNRIS